MLRDDRQRRMVPVLAGGLVLVCVIIGGEVLYFRSQTQGESPSVTRAPAPDPAQDREGGRAKSASRPSPTRIVLSPGMVRDPFMPKEAPRPRQPQSSSGSGLRIDLAPLPPSFLGPSGGPFPPSGTKPEPDRRWRVTGVIHAGNPLVIIENDEQQVVIGQSQAVPGGAHLVAASLHSITLRRGNNWSTVAVGDYLP